MEEHFSRNEHDHEEIIKDMRDLSRTVNSMQRTLDRTSTRVAMIVVGASIVVSVIVTLIHYATAAP